MREDINLIPEEEKPRQAFLKLSKTLEKIDIVLFLIFLVTSVVLAGAFWMFSGRRDDLQNTQEELKSEIRALEETEQELILVQDRLTKIKKIYNLKSAEDELDSLREIIGAMGPNTRFNSADLTSEDLSVSLVTNSSSSMAQLFANLIAGGYQRIELTNFNVNEDGYNVGLSLVR